ncbi:pyruvate formate lyase family protein [Enhygromyxa salina]|nr:pyruvate formate lyase family protein [Enhygromyxa salina]
MPRILRLRARHLATPTEICIERAQLITQFMTQLANRDEPPQLLVARRVRHYLAHREVTIHDDNLLAGSTTSKPIGAPIYPEFDGLMIWPELEVIGARKVNPQLLSPADAEILDLQVFPHWIDKPAIERLRARVGSPSPVSLRLLERLAFFSSGEVNGISRCVPAYERVLREGMEGIIAEARGRERVLDATRGPEIRDQIWFYQSVQIALQGAIEHANKLASVARSSARDTADATRRAELEALARICEQVPAKPARTFREAINSLWLCQIALHAENVNVGLSPGRLDQILWPFYRRDIEDGVLTPEQALELCCCLWLKLGDNTKLVHELSERLWGGAGSTPAVTLGGVDERGRDAVNDLTYVLLRTTELMALREPSVTARFHCDINDRSYRQRVVQVIVNTGAVPAIHNDLTAIEALGSQGHRRAHARDFAVIGGSPVSAGRDLAACGSIMLNLARALELTLLQGKTAVTKDEQIGPVTADPCSFACFEQLWEAFTIQLRTLVGHVVEIDQALGRIHQQWLPTPLRSALFEGPLELGQDASRGGAIYNSSGASHVGFADVCDSFSAIEVGVFRDGRVTMAELVAALHQDFGPSHARLRNYLRYKPPKFGSEDPISARNAARLVDCIHAVYQPHINCRDGRYWPTYATSTSHAGHGKLCGALPNGRRAHKVFSGGLTPTAGAVDDLDSVLNAVAAVGSQPIPGGATLEIKCTPRRPDESPVAYIERLGDLIEAHFRKGGTQLQFNIRSYEELIDAMDHPHKYEHLIVQVSGHTAYFNDLSVPMKEELISQTQYHLATGAAAPLPTWWREGGRFADWGPL